MHTYRASVPDSRPRTGLAASIRIFLIGCGALGAPSVVCGQHLTTTGGATVPGGSFTSSVILDNPQVANGWSYTVCHDPTVLTLIDADLGADGSVVNGGEPPGFSELQIYPEGWSVGVVINLIGAETLPTGVFEIGRGFYEGESVGSTTLCPCTIGTPPVSTVVVYSGASLVPTLDCGTVVVAEGPYLVRGDANFDGAIDLADGIRILTSLFLANMALSCHDAGDANGDAIVNIADAVLVLNFLFAAGEPPVAPFPDCGSVPEADCDAGTVCPESSR